MGVQASAPADSSTLLPSGRGEDPERDQDPDSRHVVLLTSEGSPMSSRTASGSTAPLGSGCVSPPQEHGQAVEKNEAAPSLMLSIQPQPRDAFAVDQEARTLISPSDLPTTSESVMTFASNASTRSEDSDGGKATRRPRLSHRASGSFLSERSRGSCRLNSDDSGRKVIVKRRSFDTRTFVPGRLESKIDRRYQIEPHHIGQGGFGRVFLAKDRTVKDRWVAVKKLARQDSQHEEVLRAEVEIMQALDHPSICKIFEWYREGRFFFFVIEHLEGGDLCDRISDSWEGKMDERAAAEILKQASGALMYAHRKGIAHRDMKPENVCFCFPADHDDLRIKVIDWGLGKYFVQAKMRSSVGSMAFTAPEVLDPQDETSGYTSSCDLWSLGVMAYYTLSGIFPFDPTAPVAMLGRMKKETYDMTGPQWHDVSSTAKDFIRRLLKSNPEERMASDCLLAHPWLNERFVEPNPSVFKRILSNVEHYSHAPDFLAILVASVAAQLDHRDLNDVYKVFTALDDNGDGLLELDDVRRGFIRVFGAESMINRMQDLEDMFNRVDLDGTGRITYTEFCAAGIGESSYTQEQVLWAAFKTFDIKDEGRISREDLQQVLHRGDLHEAWTEAVCQDAAQQILEQFAGVDGHINFQEWLELMRECASLHHDEVNLVRENSGLGVSLSG